MTRFNNLCSDKEIESFSAFYIAPLRNDASEAEASGNGTCIVQCEPGEAEFYGIYGSQVSKNGCEWLAVHDEATPEAIVRIARQINAELGKPFFYRDERYGCIPTHGAKLDFTEIAEALTEEIHDELPDVPAEDFRDDDFDNHVLAQMREAFVDYSDFSGLDMARDPYQPIESA